MVFDNSNINKVNLICRYRYFTENTLASIIGPVAKVSRRQINDVVHMQLSRDGYTTLCQLLMVIQQYDLLLIIVISSELCWHSVSLCDGDGCPTNYIINLALASCKYQDFSCYKKILDRPCISLTLKPKRQCNYHIFTRFSNSAPHRHVTRMRSIAHTPSVLLKKQ